MENTTNHHQSEEKSNNSSMETNILPNENDFHSPDFPQTKKNSNNNEQNNNEILDSSIQQKFNKELAEGISKRKENKLEEAIKIFEDLLRKAESVLKDEYELVAYHFELGNTLLTKVENSRDVFGDAIQASNKNIENNSSSDDDEDNDDQQIKDRDTVEIRDEVNDLRISNNEENRNENNRESQIPNLDRNDDDNVDDLQVAWEHLEVARIFSERKLKLIEGQPNFNMHVPIMKFLADIMLRLGDANCYKDNFNGAIEDYKKALELRKFIDDHYTSRELSEVYYLLGNAHLYLNTEEGDITAINYFNKSRIILENILFKYMNSIENKDPEDEKNYGTMLSSTFLTPNIFETQEVKDMKGILIDLYHKIEDTTEQRKERAKVVAELLKSKKEAEQSISETGFAKPILATSKSDNNNNSSTPNKSNDSQQDQKTEPMKVITLGVFGNAKKRPREEITNLNLSNTNGTKTDVNNDNVNGINSSGQKNGNTSKDVSGSSVTKADDLGHPEKILKM